MSRARQLLGLAMLILGAVPVLVGLWLIGVRWPLPSTTPPVLDTPPPPAPAHPARFVARSEVFH